ncbi:MAG TPA: DUF5985 family protein [Vicinamibacterales bacterium]|jgi:hypothetical protein|nr:DUF5985 family protein [Vicinamibacterales bacterium]
MPSIVYGLCAAASLFCAALVLSHYRRSGGRVLLWVALAFCGLVVNNLLLFYDLVVAPALDFSLLRSISAAAALVLLLFGLIWDGV